MIARELLGTAQVPGGEELRLFSHGRDFMIVLDRNELMSTRMRGSEEALATMTLERLGRAGAAPADRRLRHGLHLARRARRAAAGRVTVAELVPEIIEWARGPMAELTAGCLDDPRVTLRHGRRLGLHRRCGRRYDRALRRDPARRRQRPRRARPRSRTGGSTRSPACAPPRPRWRRAACWRSGRRGAIRRSPAGSRRRASRSRKSKSAPGPTTRARATRSGSRGHG